jgi:pimeloyl-ACP methyl ester carboxylesterase
MRETQTRSGAAPVQNALLYYETAGEGQPFVMIHAGVADHRQWNNEFAYFAKRYQVIRYDMRGFGKSEPVEGEYSNLKDLIGLLDYLHIEQPVILMGCSMGGRLAMDFVLAQPDRAKALIMVCSAPTGLALDVSQPPIFDEIEQADIAGDLDRVADLEVQAWFDGDRPTTQVNPEMRQLAYEMNYTALTHDAKGLGKRLPDSQTLASEHLSKLELPVLVIVGANDIPYSQAAAEYMEEKISNVQKVVIEDAAHLTNMDQPAEFQSAVEQFLQKL